MLKIRRPEVIIRDNRGLKCWKRDQVSEGYTLFGPSNLMPGISGYESEVYLVDMEGNPVHSWSFKRAYQLCQLLPNGHLLEMNRDRDEDANAGLYELDWEGNMVWHFICRIDHDFHVMENGNIMAHCLKHHFDPKIQRDGFARTSLIIEINQKKQVVWQWHIDEHLKELEELVGLKGPWKNPDWAHNNTCEVLPDTPLGKKDGRFRKGNILFSLRNLDTIGIIDKQTSEIVWCWGKGIIDKQHMPTMLPNGNILIFDNGPSRGWSRVIEIEPLSGNIVWEYRADPPKAFFSPAISGAERLPNGNTFICEGAKGHLFEVTAEGEIVWDYYQPFKGGRGYITYRACRYSKEYVDSILDL